MSENDDWVLDDCNVGPVIPSQLVHNLRRTANWLHYLGILLFIPSFLRFCLNFITLFQAYGVNNSFRHSPSYFASLKLSLIAMGFVILLSIISIVYGMHLKRISRNQNFNIGELLHLQNNYWMIVSVSTTAFLFLYIAVSYSIT